MGSNSSVILFAEREYVSVDGSIRFPAWVLYAAETFTGLSLYINLKAKSINTYSFFCCLQDGVIQILMLMPTFHFLQTTSLPLFTGKLTLTTFMETATSTVYILRVTNGNSIF